MFGHHEDQHDTTLPSPAPDGALADDTQTPGAPLANDAGEFLDDVSPATPPPMVTKPADNAPTSITGGAPAASAPADENDTDDAGMDDTSAAAPAPAPATDTAASAPTTAPNTDELLDIKQQALQQLTPLIGHLDQDPEEKFRTTMMMIQAADNHELIQTAYEAAQQIKDEKVRAQALLDIVNEINYFTHNNATGGGA